MKKRILFPLSVITLIAVIIGVIFIPGMTAGAEEYNEKNPDFAEAEIDSDVELSYGYSTSYVQSTEFKQDSASGKYEITTDAFVAWYTSDDVAMLYRQYNIGDTSNDKLTVELTVESQSCTKNGQGLYSTASSGIMLRGSIKDAASPSLFLHTRATGVDVVYRSENGIDTLHAPSGFEPVYPVVLRVEKVGNKYTCSFKNANMNSFKVIGSLGCKIAGPIYVGPAAHCSKQDLPIHSVFSNYSAVGSGSVEVSEDTESGTVDTGPKPLDAEDPPFDPETTLLYETFTDGSMTDGEEAVNNPIWLNSDGSIVTNEDETNRRWYKSFADTTEYIGSQYWTDYSVSMDFEISDGLDPQANDRIILWVRQKDIDPYGYYGTAVVIETTVTVNSDSRQVVTPQLNIYHKQRSSLANMGTKKTGTDIDKMIGTGVHNLRVDCLDNILTVYIDGKKIISWADESTSPNLRGNIGIGTTEIEAYFDNIKVTKLNDENGGDYDNYTGANYEDGIPQYVQQFMETYEVEY